MKFFGQVDRDPRRKLLDSDVDPDSFVDSWIIFHDSLPLTGRKLTFCGMSQPMKGF